MTEIIKLPYSVFSHDRYKELCELIRDMGYDWIKVYPDGTNVAGVKVEV